MNHSYIVFYDGVCYLCNSLVQFVLKYEREKHVSFAQLQSTVAKKSIPNLPKNNFDSVVFFNKKLNKIYFRSAAVVQLLWFMGGGWKALALCLWVIPLPIRNFGYRLIARFRYRIFGKADQCFFQPKTDRFIEDI